MILLLQYFIFIRYIVCISICLLLSIWPCLSPAQKTAYLLTAGSHIEAGAKVRDILRKNNIPFDSLKALVNQKLVTALGAEAGSGEVVGVPDELSAGIQQHASLLSMPTAKYLEQVEKLSGIKKVGAINDRSAGNYYLALNIPDSLLLVMRTWLQGSATDRLVVLTSVNFSNTTLLHSKTNFIFHYEVYDSNMMKINTGKTSYKYKLSRKMYFHVFEYYLSVMLRRIAKQTMQ